MRRHLVLAAAAVLAAGIAVTSVVAQQRGDPRDPARRPTTGRQSPAGDDVMPMGPGPGTRLESVLVRPNRVYVRDVWRVGRFECRPWNAEADTPKGWLRINALMAHDEQHPDDKGSGVEIVLEDEAEDRTFIFDSEQIRDLLDGLTALSAASDRLREAQQGSRRHAVFTLNGLEIGMNPRRTGGYLAPLGPDERSLGLSPDNFADLRRALEAARDLIARETERPADR